VGSTCVLLRRTRFGVRAEVQYDCHTRYWWSDEKHVAVRARYESDRGFTDTLSPSVVRASVDLFDTPRAQILAGRNFMAGDVGVANAVVVNRSFADMYLQDANALGLRFRYVKESGPRQVGDRETARAPGGSPRL